MATDINEVRCFVLDALAFYKLVSGWIDQNFVKLMKSLICISLHKLLVRSFFVECLPSIVC